MQKVLFAILSAVAIAASAETDYPSSESLERLWTRYDRMNLRLENVEGGVTAVAAITNGTLSSNKVFIGSSANIAAEQTITGDINITTGGVVAITSGAILNADINTNAAIELTKLASVSPGSLIIGNASSQAVAVAMSGDGLIGTNGVFSITTNSIVNADVKTNAAIASTKIDRIALTSTNTGSATVIPTLSTPLFVGQILVNTASNFVYVSKGLTTNDWLPAN